MNIGDVEGGPMRMVRRYATACRMCGIASQGPQGPAFFAAIFGDDDSAIFGIERSEIIAWRRYVCENVPVSRHGPEVTAQLLAALERLSRG
jgi:hypothetical protein